MIDRRDAEYAEILNVFFNRRSGFSRNLLALTYSEFAAEAAPTKHTITSAHSASLRFLFNGLMML